MQIHELPSSASPVYTDEIPIDNGTATQRTNLKDLADLINQRRTLIPDNADLNTYTTPGSYYCVDSTSAATIAHAPIVTGNFRLEVISGGLDNYSSYIVQFCWGTSTDDFYMRRKHSTWSDWTRFYNTKFDALGSQIKSEPSSVNVSNNTVTQIGDGITLPAGSWVINAGVNFASNSTGYREFYLTRGDSSAWVVEHATSNAVNGAATYFNIAAQAVLSSDVVFKMKVKQNSGSTLTTTARFYAIRVG